MEANVNLDSSAQGERGRACSAAGARGRGTRGGRVGARSSSKAAGSRTTTAASRTAAAEEATTQSAAACAAAIGVAAGRERVAAEQAALVQAVADTPSAHAAPGAGRRPASASPSDGGADSPFRKRGKGKQWSSPERVALCEAYADATLNTIDDTDASKEEFWQGVQERFVALAPVDLSENQRRGRWGSRTVGSVMNEFLRNISPCTQRFAHFYHVASSSGLTGNLSDADIIRAARGLYTATGAYAAVRKECEQEEELEKEGKPPPSRRARQLPENWVPCW